MGTVVAGCLAASSVSGPAASQTPEQFFAGRTVNFVVGVSPGGGYDQYARLLARHFARHLPGQPNIIVRNMPGAGSLTAVLHLNGAAAADGTNIVAFNAGLLNDSMNEGDAARAKFTEFAWIGSITRDFRVCFAWKATGILTWDDLIRRKESVFGASGANSSSANNVAMLRNLFGLNLRTIHGYPGNTEMFLAIERGEVEGSCVTWSSMPDHWVRNGTIAVLTRLSPAAAPGIPDSVKYIGDLVTTQEQKDIIDVLLAPGELGRPFIASRKNSRRPPRGPARGFRRFDEGPDASRRRRQAEPAHRSSRRRRGGEDRRAALSFPARADREGEERREELRPRINSQPVARGPYSAGVGAVATLRRANIVRIASSEKDAETTKTRCGRPRSRMKP